MRGRVDIGIPVATRRPSAAYTPRSVPAPPLAPASEVRHVVVYLKDAPPRPMPPVRVEILQRNETFVPRVVAVPVGSVVAFPERRPDLPQRLLAVARQGIQSRPLSARPVEGGALRQARHRQGVLRHPLAHERDGDGVQPPVVRRSPTTRAGSSCPDVPPGDREITAWHERLGDTTQRVQRRGGPADGGRLRAAGAAAVSRPQRSDLPGRGA